MPCKTPTKLRIAAFEAQQGRCYYCGQPMWLSDPEQFAEAHGIPLKQAALLQCTAEHLRARWSGWSGHP